MKTKTRRVVKSKVTSKNKKAKTKVKSLAPKKVKVVAKKAVKAKSSAVKKSSVLKNLFKKQKTTTIGAYANVGKSSPKTPKEPPFTHFS